MYRKMLVLTLFIGQIAFGQDGSGWDFNPAKYNLDFSIVGQIDYEGSLSINLPDEVAAFDREGNLRGVSTLAYNSAAQKYLVNLTVLSNTSGDSIWFKVYDSESDTIKDVINDPILFVPNELEGSVGQPYTFFTSNYIQDIHLSDTAVSENAMVDFVGVLTSDVAVSIGETIIEYSLVEGDGAQDNTLFRISGDSLYTKAPLNYEATEDGTLSILVQATDTNGIELVKAFHVSLQDENDMHTMVLLTPDSIEENNSLGDTVGVFSTVDEDNSDSFTYEILQTPFTDHEHFIIVGEVLRANQVFDFEQKSEYSIEVKSTDQHGNSLVKTIDIQIVDQEIEAIGYAQIHADLLMVYPNPSTGRFYVQFEQAMNRHLAIYNIQGEQVYQMKTDALQTVITEDLPRGTYILQIAVGERVRNVRLVQD